MQEDRQWRTIIVSGFIMLLFTVIYLTMNQLAKFEENELRAKIFEIQEGIAKSMSSDYEVGLNLLEEQIEANRLDQVKTRFIMLDDLILSESEEGARNIIDELMDYHTGSYALFQYNTLRRIEVGKHSNVYVPSGLMVEIKKSLKTGEVLRKEGAILNPASPSERPVLYFYWLKSKDWIIACESQEVEMVALKERGEALLQDNFNDVDRYLNYELLVVNPEGVIIKCSEKSYIGRELLIDSNDDKNNLSHFRITKPGQDDVKMVGNHILASDGNIIFAMSEGQYNKEKSEIHRLLQFILICNLILGVNVVRLLGQNYMYYLESRKKEGSLE